MAWTGDPTFLEDVLKPALGDRLRTLDGWRDRGHGDFGDVRGVMWHHTGNSRESAESIARGRPDLAGPLANLHIAPNGVVTIVAVGVCWHAGVGSYPWLPTNNANSHMIGVECAWPNIKADGSFDRAQPWPDAQIVSMRDVAAALSLKLGVDASHNIGHKEYAGAAQGKWDPNLDMNWFRAEVAKDMRGEFDRVVTVPVVVDTPASPPILPAPPLAGFTDRQLWEEILRQQRGPLLKGWDQLDGKTVVDYLAELGGTVDEINRTLAAGAKFMAGAR
ncbi:MULTISPECIES: N-acetylmuramoyl-L-alanine amidase [unclassified Mycobacterium]|uniref:peptidoglycan recognition protein family protein n=1 Tax=unclassified Mycobacterium TaxID=2642494 RepID=UPI0029C75D3A|nr:MULTISPECIES: N-acetylmuramoyl-L-alanine amidase [unclassified Mycobacterium]